MSSLSIEMVLSRRCWRKWGRWFWLYTLRRAFQKEGFQM